MRKRATKSIRGYALFVTMTVMFSCDSFEGNDTIKPILTQSDYYTLPGSSIIIDITSLSNQSYTNLSISISKDPSKGIFTQVNKLLFKYKPGFEFVDGEDQFVLTTKNNEEILATQTVTIHMKKTKGEFSCGVIPVEDIVEVKPGSSVSIPVLENDWFCDIDKSSLTISIDMQPQFGQAIIQGESIIYSAGPDYKGNDEFIYKLQPSSTENAVYGVISVTNRRAKFMHAPPGDFTQMVFVNDNIGYLAGYARGYEQNFGPVIYYGASFYITTDGGEHWSEVSLPNGIDYIEFVDLNFLNEEEGVALYVPSCDYVSPDCGFGLVTTKTGGSVWNAIPIQPFGAASSVFFTSSTTGFIGTTSGVDGGVDGILKTEDGGATWNQVLATTGSDIVRAIKFSDAQTGYAQTGGGQQVDRIWITEDSGESWKLLTTLEHSSAVAVVGRDKIFASRTTPSSFNNSSAIVRFHGTSTWEKVADFPYNILEIEFSPSGNVGFAAGNSSPYSNPKIVVINKSIDGGETWTEEHIEGYIEPNSLPKAMAVPSENVVYILYDDIIIKYTNY